MRHLHADSSFRLAIAAFADSDGYVDALLGLARHQIVARRPAIAQDVRGRLPYRSLSASVAVRDSAIGL